MIFNTGYHCLVAGLPELQFDEGRITSTLMGFREDLKKELSLADYKSVHALFLPYDNANLLTYLKSPDSNLDPLGNYGANSFEEQINRLKSILHQPDVLEPYMVGFLKRWFAEDSDRYILNPSLVLLASYFEEMIAGTKGFLKIWLEFDRNLRNIMTALVCRRHKLDPSGQMLGSDGIVPLLVKNTSRDFGLGTDLDYIERVIQISEIADLMEREKRLDLFRWEYIEEKTTFHYFDLEIILAYLIKLGIVLRWTRLDKSAGEKMFRSLIGQLENSYEFPDDFKRRK